MVDLSYAMVDAGFWEIGDAQLATAWVKDLKAVGYVPPDLVASW